MIIHIVMWKINNKDVSAPKIKKDLEALKGKIKEIHKIEVGINFNESEAASDVVLYSEFASKENLNIYQSHPEHLKVAGFIGIIKTERVVVDYER